MNRTSHTKINPTQSLYHLQCSFTMDMPICWVYSAVSHWICPFIGWQFYFLGISLQILLSYYFFLSLFIWDTVSLCNPVFHDTYYLDQPDLKLTETACLCLPRAGIKSMDTHTQCKFWTLSPFLKSICQTFSILWGVHLLCWSFPLLCFLFARSPSIDTRVSSCALFKTFLPTPVSWRVFPIFSSRINFLPAFQNPACGDRRS